MAASPARSDLAASRPADALRLTVDFDTSVAFLLTSLANKLSIAASRRLRRELDVGLMEWRVLVLLAVEDQATPARIAQVAGVDKSVVSRAVSGLERRGLITVSSEPASRQTRLGLTSAGQALHDRGIVGSRQAEAELLDGVPEGDRELLRALLRRLIGNLPRLDPSAPGPP